LPEVELTEEDYFLLEKWYGMLFAGDTKVLNAKSKTKDKVLFQKLSVMHVALIEERLADLQSERDDA
jgi:hypothetical protein